MTEDTYKLQQLLYFKMQLLQAEIAMNAMIAENKQRENEGKSFMKLINENVSGIFWR